MTQPPSPSPWAPPDAAWPPRQEEPPQPRESDTAVIPAVEPDTAAIQVDPSQADTAAHPHVAERGAPSLPVETDEPTRVERPPPPLGPKPPVMLNPLPRPPRAQAGGYPHAGPQQPSSVAPRSFAADTGPASSRTLPPPPKPVAPREAQPPAAGPPASWGPTQETPSPWSAAQSPQAPAPQRLAREALQAPSPQHRAPEPPAQQASQAPPAQPAPQATAPQQAPHAAPPQPQHHGPQATAPQQAPQAPPPHSQQGAPQAPPQLAPHAPPPHAFTPQGPYGYPQAPPGHPPQGYAAYPSAPHATARQPHAPGQPAGPRAKGWWRRNLWGLIVLLPVLALALGPSVKEGLDGYNRRVAHEAVHPGADGWVSYGGARLRLVEFGPATDLKTDDGQAFQPPGNTKVWKAVLAVEAADKDSVAACNLKLEDSEGRLFSANPTELSGTRTLFPSCTPDNDEAPSPWQVEMYFVTPAAAQPEAVRVGQGLQLPRYARLATS